MQLRTYQQEAVNKMIWSRNLTGNDLIVLPTGSGKSIVIAEAANAFNTSLLIIQPSKEILMQNYQKLLHYVNPVDIGIYSASMNEKTIKKYTLGTIGSLYKKGELFPHFRIVILDECDLLNPRNFDTMYMKFFKAIGNPKIYGLTASPYRLCPSYVKSTKPWISEWETVTTIKLINRLQGNFWTRILTVVNHQDLIDQDFLVPLRYVERNLFTGPIKMNKSRSDYDVEWVEKNLVRFERQIVGHLSYAIRHYKSTLVFCPGVESAKMIAAAIPGVEWISALTKTKERTRIIEGFKNGIIRGVCNVGVLTCGFDHPALDCIILSRPTQSLRLYYQMLGRGVRKSEGKKECTVLDLCGNTARMGRIETIKVTQIDGKWELISERGSWHGRELYRYQT